jgi:hypothetical protein
MILCILEDIWVVVSGWGWRYEKDIVGFGGCAEEKIIWHYPEFGLICDYMDRLKSVMKSSSAWNPTRQ